MDKNPEQTGISPEEWEQFYRKREEKIERDEKRLLGNERGEEVNCELCGDQEGGCQQCGWGRERKRAEAEKRKDDAA